VGGHSATDALIAASAEAIDAAVLTRNDRDFALTSAAVESY
jgi:predicted nucleic acid-binding protein